MTETLRVAVIQQPPVFLNLRESLRKALSLTREAAEKGARLITFGESWLPGYPVWLDHAPKAALWDHAPAKALYRLLVENAVDVDKGDLDPLRKMARQQDVYVVMGAHEKVGGCLYNTTFFIGPQTFESHRKLVPTYTERLIWGRGDGAGLRVLATPFGRLGGLICWEHWMPLARAAMHAKGEAVHVAQWPAVGEAHQIASRHYAFEGRCFVLAAGCQLTRGDVLNGFHSLEVANPGLELLESIPGGDGDLLQNGGSAVIGPDGKYVAGPLFKESTVLYAECDMNRIAEEQLTLDTHGHYARPDIFRLEVNESPQDLVAFRGDITEPEEN